MKRADGVTVTTVLRKIGSVLLTAIAAIVLGAMVHFYATASPLNGVWLKQSGQSKLPDEMSLDVSRGTWKMRYWDGPGITTVTLQLDGHGHTLSPLANPIGGTTITAYWAELKGDTLVVTKKVERNPSTIFGVKTPGWEDAWVETWNVTPEGDVLKVSVPGTPETTYRRAPWTRRLFRASP